jgi:glycerophosphoryl diester phosphodiesterase
MLKKLIGGHRGSPKKAKENTLESFSTAILDGADFIEFDVRYSKDRKLIIHHDPALKGHILKEMNYDEILNLSSSSGYKVPLLEDVIDLCKGKIKLDIEIKEPETTEETVEKTLLYFKPEDFIITSFHDNVITKINNKLSNLKKGLLFDDYTKKDLRARIIQLKPDFILPDCRNFDFTVNGLIPSLPFEIKAVYWNVNTIEEMQKTLENNLTKGIISDFPDIAVKENHYFQG